jgi:hypothetical protein
MKVKIQIPEDLSEVTLEQYQYLMEIQNPDDDDEFAARKLISVLCKIPLSQVMYIDYSSASELLAKFNQMFSEEKMMYTRFKLNNVEFGFIPDIEKISFGEYIDCEKYMSSWKTMHNAMAVLYRPIVKTKGDKYEIENYEGSATYEEVMKAMPLSVALGANVFFWNLVSELLEGLIVYLQNEVKKEVDLKIIAKYLNLPEDGDGINQFMELQKATLRDLKKLPVYHLTNA